MSIVYLQEKINVTADGIFGPNTLRAAMNHYNMTTLRACHFFAQCAHESGNFRTFSENLNYSARGLKTVFRKYFKTDDLINQYKRNPKMIASRVYANRMGNGDENSGEGWMFRGRGAIQLTGKNNYQAFSDYINDPEIMTNPDIVATKYSFESAIFFFDSNSLWDICDRGVDNSTIRRLTRRINGGTNGLTDRINKTRKYAALLDVI